MRISGRADCERCAEARMRAGAGKSGRDASIVKQAESAVKYKTINRSTFFCPHKRYTACCLRLTLWVEAPARIFLRALSLPKTHPPGRLVRRLEQINLWLQLWDAIPPLLTKLRVKRPEPDVRSVLLARQSERTQSLGGGDQPYTENVPSEWYSIRSTATQGAL